MQGRLINGQELAIHWGKPVKAAQPLPQQPMMQQPLLQQPMQQAMQAPMHMVGMPHIQPSVGQAPFAAPSLLPAPAMMVPAFVPMSSMGMSVRLRVRLRSIFVY